MEIYVIQRKYILDLLNEIGMLGCKLADTPIDQNHQLGTIIEGILVDKGRWISKTCWEINLFFPHETRYNICCHHGKSIYALLLECHMDVVLRILRYLKSTLGDGLLFLKNNHLRVKACTNADWVGSITDKKSISGIVLLQAVTWLLGEAKNRI